MTPDLNKESQLSQTEVARIPGTERQDSTKQNLPFLLMLALLVISALLTTWLAQERGVDEIPARAALDGMSKQLGAWQERETDTLDPRTLEVLKPDDYLQRTYVDAQGVPAYLFIGYFASQRSGNTYHSPQNCLPGAGWTMEPRSRQTLGPVRSAGQGEINQFIVSKEGTQLMTLYWYQGRGRTVASEYWGKVFTVTDAVLRQRTDGALVRVMLPIDETSGGEKAALEKGMDFVNRLLPELPRYIPE